MFSLARFCLPLLLLFHALPALAGDDLPVDAHTIRAADLPANPPRFDMRIKQGP